jgi:hypothetical protein
MLQNLSENIDGDRRHGGNVDICPRRNGDIKKSAFALTIHARLTSNDSIAPISDRSRFSDDIFTTLSLLANITVFSSKFAYLLAQNIFDPKFLSLCDCTIAAM